MRNKKILLTGLVFLALALGAGGYYLATRGDKAASPSNDINYGPPTEEEISAGDKQKEEIVDRKNQLDKNDGQLNDGQSKKTATVIITDAGQYGDVIEVRSFISDHYEDGTCIIKLQKGNAVITKETPAYRDASTTICTNPLIKRSEFPSAGDWQVTVSYKSPGATGESKTKTIQMK